jgi:hypothetical protein
MNLLAYFYMVGYVCPQVYAASVLFLRDCWLSVQRFSTLPKRGIMQLCLADLTHGDLLQIRISKQ